jgi:hypothetical protein
MAVSIHTVFENFPQHQADIIMDLLKVLHITEATVVGSEVYATYAAPSWMADSIESVVAEDSPTGQFIRGFVLGRVIQYDNEDLGGIETIYLQSENLEMPSMTLFLTSDNDGFGSGYNFGGFSTPNFGAIPSVGNRIDRVYVDKERIDCVNQGRQMAREDLDSFRSLFAKVSTISR